MMTTQSQPRNEAGARRVSATLLVFCSLITILGFTLVCASIMFNMRAGEEEIARQSSENLVSTIDADIARNIEIYDLSLRAVATHVLSPEISRVSRELQHLILFDHAATAKHFGAIQVFDVTGKLTIDASTFDPAPISSADQEFFFAHRDHPDIGLYISSPMLYRGAYSVVMSRRISDNEGNFVGVVAGALRFSFFHELFGRLRLGPDDVIAVMRQDGVLIMRVPFDLDWIGRSMATSELTKRALAEPNGSMSHTSLADGLSRLYVWRDNTRPLVVVVGKTWTSIYAVWQQQALRIGGILFVLVLMAGIATLCLAREIGRRTRAEASLAELATTDALTGLRNRRKFDQQLADEWRRAERSGVALALLMIDADHFKAYNDRFGHQAGDQALCAVAAGIIRASRRVGDCAARYGGEEFALLLPGLSLLESLQIAETIRKEIGRWNGGCAQLSVSIGVASMTPGGGTSAEALVEAADRALYEAKTNGRNQSRVAPRHTIALVA